MQKREAYVGIDLGTTNCVVSYYTSDKRTDTIHIANSVLVRSAIDFLENGKMIVGDMALRNAKDLVSGNVVLNAKRVIGKKINSVVVNRVKESCRAEVVADDMGYAAFAIPHLHRVVKPEEVSAHLLNYLYTNATRQLQDYVIKGVVITVPASFDSDQRFATMRAIRMSELPKNTSLLSEPTAAAISHGVLELNYDMNILVYDLGGGTFDVSVMSIRNGRVFRVIATDGICGIGGEDFDVSILNALMNQYTSKNPDESLLPESVHEKTDEVFQKCKSKLLEQCRIAKEELSYGSNDSVDIDLSEYFDGGWNDESDDPDDYSGLVESFTFSLTREVFEALIERSIDRTIRNVQKCLDMANLTPNSIHRVILVGGSSRIPLIRKKLAALFPLDRIILSDPDTCVSKGAAYYGAARDKVVDISVEDCIARYSYYTMMKEHKQIVFDPIITKGTVLPSTNTKSYVLRNAYCMEDTVFCGEEPKQESCEVLATISCSRIPLTNGKAVLSYSFKLAKDGVLYYSIVEEQSKQVLVSDHVVSNMEMKKSCVC